MATSATESAFPHELAARYRSAADVLWDSWPIDQEAWEAALAATGASGATTTPRSWRDLLSTTYAGELRANALAIASYLESGLDIAPVRLVDPGHVATAIVHHGGIATTGDWSFQRWGGEPLACLVTGDLHVGGTIWGSAFDGELMVGGDIDCGALISDSEIGVGGAVTCKYARLGWYDCCNAMGRLVTDVYVDHGMTIEGTIEARLRIECDDHDTRIPASQHDKIRAALLPELAEAILSKSEGDAYEALDDVVCRRLLRDEPVFRA